MLKKGSCIAIVAPSHGLGDIYPHMVELGISVLEGMGLRVQKYPTVSMTFGEVYSNPKCRAEEIMDALQNPEIDMIISLIGGNESIRILEYLDDTILQKYQKPIMGFSDATVYLTYMQNYGMPCIYGPSLIAGIAQLPEMEESYRALFHALFFTDSPKVRYPNFEGYYNAYRDFHDVENKGELEEYRISNGPTILQGRGRYTGRFIGGCIESFEQLKQTYYFPEKERFKNAFLFFETSEMVPSPYQIKDWLRSYRYTGIFDEIAALFFAIPKNYSDADKKSLESVVYEICILEHGMTCPIILEMPFGHTEPQVPLLLDSLYTFDCDTKTLTLHRN